GKLSDLKPPKKRKIHQQTIETCAPPSPFHLINKEEPTFYIPHSPPPQPPTINQQTIDYLNSRIIPSMDPIQALANLAHIPRVADLSKDIVWELFNSPIFTNILQAHGYMLQPIWKTQSRGNGNEHQINTLSNPIENLTLPLIHYPPPPATNFNQNYMNYDVDMPIYNQSFDNMQYVDQSLPSMSTPGLQQRETNDPFANSFDQTISWNCRGCSNPSTIRHLKDLINNINPDILFLSETKTSPNSITYLINQLNYPHQHIVHPVHLAGGLCLLWKAGININILSSTKHSITTVVNSGAHGEWVGCYPYKENRDLSWNPIWDLEYLNSPTMIIGDLNVILSSHEHPGGKTYEFSDGEQAHTIVNNLGLIDLGFMGYPFTWSNKRVEPDNIQKRLDRVLVNKEWLLLFPESIVHNKPAIASDHCPILLNTNPTSINSPKPFKF
ncbi:hypothetical protein IFM89_015966, partial [Coptis chinensis]